MIGGSGALNAMIYIRGLASDYDAWEKMGCAGWGWKDVFPTFLKSENNADFTDSPYHGNSGPLHIGNVPYVDRYERLWIESAEAAGYVYNPDYNGETQEGVGLFQFTIKNGERWGTGKGFLRPALERGNVTLKTGVLVTGLIIENGRVKGVNYLVNGVAETAHADSEVVMTGGAIGTAQIMMLSGIGPADELAAVGVRPVHDLPGVGKDLQDHLNIPISFYAKEPMGIGAWTSETIDASFAEWRDHRTGIRTSPWVASGAMSARGRASSRTSSSMARSARIATMHASSAAFRRHRALDAAAAEEPRARSGCARPIRWNIPRSTRNTSSPIPPASTSPRWSRASRSTATYWHSRRCAS